MIICSSRIWNVINVDIKKSISNLWMFIILEGYGIRDFFNIIWKFLK